MSCLVLFSPFREKAREPLGIFFTKKGKKAKIKPSSKRLKLEILINVKELLTP
jgi:hypothetical protein